MPNGSQQKNGQHRGGARGGGARGGGARSGDARGGVCRSVVCHGGSTVGDIRAGIMPAHVITVVGLLATCFRLMNRYFDLAVDDLRIRVCDATLIADVSNQRWFVQFIAFCNFTTRFTIIPQLIASRTTIMEVVPAIFAHMVHIVRDGIRTRDERLGVDEDQVVADRIMACSGPIVLACGDGKADEGEDGVIFRAVRAHLEAGRKMVIMAKTGTCSGNYKRLQEEFPALLRVVDRLIPE